MYKLPLMFVIYSKGLGCPFSPELSSMINFLLFCIAQSFSVSSSYCHYWQVRCNNGQCVNRDNLCDGLSQCYDGSDEWSSNCPSCMYNSESH